MTKIFGSLYHGNGRVNEINNVHIFVFVTQLALSASFNKLEVRPCMSNPYCKILDDYRELILIFVLSTELYLYVGGGGGGGICFVFRASQENVFSAQS